MLKNESDHTIFMKENTVFRETARTLCRLGITANYVGFYYTSYAVTLACKDPHRLQLVTKWLYPDVAAVYDTSIDNVRKNIDKVCSLAWERNSDFLCEMASFELKKKPGTCEFLAILSFYSTV